MTTINKAIVLGRLGHDMELSYTASGMPVGKMSVATTEKWKDASGQPQERTMWHRLVWYGKGPEVMRDAMKKGAQVYAEGRMDHREYTKKDGTAGTSYEIKVSELVLLTRVNDERASAPKEVEAPKGRVAQDLARLKQGTFLDESDIPF